MFHTDDCFCRMLWGGAGRSDKYESLNSEGIIHYTSEGTMGEKDETHITIKMRHT